MTVHPATLVLRDHQFSYASMDDGDHCSCGAATPDHPAHQADALAQAGLLAPGTPPETPTERVLKARAEAETCGLPFGDGWTCDLPAGHGGTGGGGWAHAKAPETPTERVLAEREREAAARNGQAGH